jgi:hypothetical protein
MAYGVYTPIELGKTYSASFMFRAYGSDAIGKTISFQRWNNGYASSVTSSSITSSWQKCTLTWTAEVTYASAILYWFISSGPCYVDISEIQFEQKGYATEYTSSSRAQADVWRDLTCNNNHATMGGIATYDSSNGGSLVFNGDGTQYFVLDASSTLSVNNMTISSWSYATNYSQQGFLFEKTTNGSVNTQYSLFFSGDYLFFRTFGCSNQDLNYPIACSTSK